MDQRRDVRWRTADRAKDCVQPNAEPDRHAHPIAIQHRVPVYNTELVRKSVTVADAVRVDFSNADAQRDTVAQHDAVPDADDDSHHFTVREPDADSKSNSEPDSDCERQPDADTEWDAYFQPDVFGVANANTIFF